MVGVAGLVLWVRKGFDVGVEKGLCTCRWKRAMGIDRD